MMQRHGRLIAVVGASGVGKDSVIDALVQTLPYLGRARRTITRPVDAGGESHTAVTPEVFDDLCRRGAFCIHWQAHGLQYGIDSKVLADVNSGEQCIANVSRQALNTLAELFPSMIVLNITAEPETLAQRLAARGRENASEIMSRLDREAPAFSSKLHVVDLANDGALDLTVARALDALGAVSVADLD